MKHKSLNSIASFLLGAFVVTGLSVLYAWTGPTGTAPLNNVFAPINTGTDTQLKDGPLSVTNLLAEIGLFTSRIQIGDTADVCVPDIKGSLRYHGDAIEYCDGVTWKPLGGGGGASIAGFISALSGKSFTFYCKRDSGYSAPGGYWWNIRVWTEINRVIGTITFTSTKATVVPAKTSGSHTVVEGSGNPYWDSAAYYNYTAQTGDLTPLSPSSITTTTSGTCGYGNTCSVLAKGALAHGTSSPATDYTYTWNRIMEGYFGYSEIGYVNSTMLPPTAVTLSPTNMSAGSNSWSLDYLLSLPSNSTLTLTGGCF